MDTEPLSTLTTEIVIFGISLFFCALYAFLETCVTALRLFKLKELATSSTRYKSLIDILENNPNQILNTILVASNLANVTAAAVMTNIMETVFARLNFSSGFGFSVGIGVATAVILIFGEVIPKNLAKFHGEKLFSSTLWIINVTHYLLYPFITFVIHLSNFIISKISGTSNPQETIVSESEIRFLIDYINEKGLMEKEKTEMLQSIFNLGSTPVREIMVPITDIIMIEVNASTQEALEKFARYQFSRLPVYEENKENIIGMIHLKDVFGLIYKKEEKKLTDILRTIMYVPESMKINQLLREFRQKHMHIAMVINEYGSITGLVTLENVLEEIVGEIQDEYEQSEEKIVLLEDGSWLVDGAVDLETLSERIELPFDAEDAITIGGFLTEQLQHVPIKGERILYHHHYFQVQKASDKRVYQVLIFKDTSDQQ